MESQAQSPWRQEPKPARIVIAVFGLAFLSKWVYLAITGMIWAPNVEYSILPTREYPIFQFFSSLVQFSDILIYSFVFLLAVLLCLLVTGIINLRKFFSTYVHPIKYPSLVGYIFFLFVAFEAAIAVSNAQLGLINSIIFDKDTLNLLNLYEQHNLLLNLMSLIAFIISVEWDRASMAIYSVNLKSLKRINLLREFLFAILLLPIILLTGKAYGYISKIAWNTNIALNGGELEIFRPISFAIYFFETLLIGIVMIGIFLFLYRLIPMAHNPSLRIRNYAIGLLAIIVPLAITKTVDSHIKRNYDTGKPSLKEAASLETVKPNEKTIVFFDLLDSTSSVRIEKVSLNQPSFSGRPLLYTSRYDDSKLTYNKANLARARGYLVKMAGRGAYANSAKVFLSHGYYLLMEPELGSQWFHVAAMIKPENIQRSSETFHLRISQIREPYIGYLLDYLDDAKWRIGPCQKNKFASCLNHFGKRELAKRFHEEYSSECNRKCNSKGDNKCDLPITPPLLQGSIRGEVKAAFPNTGEIRIGILGFTSPPQGKWFQQSILRWDAFNVAAHLVDATSITEQGPFLFDHLGDGFYYLVLMADPKVIPSDAKRVIVHNPPGRIELSNENPVADLGTIVIEVLPAPLKAEP